MFGECCTSWTVPVLPLITGFDTVKVAFPTIELIALTSSGSESRQMDGTSGAR